MHFTSWLNLTKAEGSEVTIKSERIVNDTSYKELVAKGRKVIVTQKGLF